MYGTRFSRKEKVDYLILPTFNDTLIKNKLLSIPASVFILQLIPDVSQTLGIPEFQKSKGFDYQANSFIVVKGDNMFHCLYW